MTIAEASGALDGAVEWVTKTNVTDYARCPRGWWLIAHGEITHEESISRSDRVEVDAGIKFECDVVAGARAVGLDSELMSGVEMNATGEPPLVLQTGLWVNYDLGLRGEPDGIEIASGAWAPVEVKHHLRATALDRLELAFYWMLLEPQREDSSPIPHGFLILGGVDGPAAPARIDLRPSHFAKVRQHVDAVRRARTSPEPLSCGRCYVCRWLRPQIVTSYDDWQTDLGSQFGLGDTRNDLGTLFDLGYNRALQLAMVGVRTSTDLFDAGVEDVLDRVRGRGWPFGRYQVEGWVAHAQAWATHEPVIYNNPPPMPGFYTTFDLEYLRQGEIWLAGMCPSDGDFTQIWAWMADDETALMRAVAEYWAARPDALMATWWGLGADIPAIRRATERTGVPFDPSTNNHFDLCHWARGHLRLPIRGLSLKDVASYFGVPDAAHGISAGDEAGDLYLRARASRSKAYRTRTRARLEAYNADDLASLANLMETLRGRYPQDEYIPPEPKPTREQRSPRAS